MNRVCLLLIASIVVLAATAASAQVSAPVYVPFAFAANHQHIPSGTYRVEVLSDDYVAFINNATRRTDCIVMVRPEVGPQIEPISSLVFASYGSKYVLKEVRMTGSSLHSVLIIQPKPEPLSAKNASYSTFEIAIR